MIMGRAESDHLHAAQILYPLMQCADIFLLKADVCQLGVDQRKVNMLARDYCTDAGRKLKPVILSHHMLYGLCAGDAKMSKSNPDSAVFMEDSPEEYYDLYLSDLFETVKRKIMQAHCPREEEKTDGTKEQQEMSVSEEKDRLKNPIIDYIKHIIFSDPKVTELPIAGTIYGNAEDVKKDWMAGKIEEVAMKEAVIVKLNDMLASVRKHFAENAEAKKLLELIEKHKATVAKEKAEGTAKPPPVRCLEGMFGSSKKNRIVFAPKIASGAAFNLDFTAVASTLAALKQAVGTSGDAKVVLWCEDWTSFVLNKFGGEKKVIASYYALLTQSLALLAPELMKNVEVKIQSEEILKNPNQYWISVIDAGRKTTLGMISAGLQEELNESSQVIQTVLHCADVLAASCCGADADVEIVAVDEQSKSLSTLAATYVRENVKPVDVVEGGGKLASVKIFLAQQAGAEGEVQLPVGKAENELNTKLKKAFCEEGNVERNPLLDLLAVLEKAGLLEGSEHIMKVEQKEEHGGNQFYKTLEDVKSAFASKALHPSGFKQASLPMIKKAMGALFTKDAGFKKEVKALETFEKKMEKKKK